MGFVFGLVCRHAFFFVDLCVCVCVHILVDMSLFVCSSGSVFGFFVHKAIELNKHLHPNISLIACSLVW